MSRRTHLVSYDVRDDRRLQKVAKHLEGYGQRIQYSVFRCRLSEKDRARLLWELSRIMQHEDALLVIPLCEHCGASVIQRGTPMSWPLEDAPFQII